MGLWALAFDAYGDRPTLFPDERREASTVVAHRGPLWFVRKRRRGLGDQDLRNWPADEPSLSGEPEHPLRLSRAGPNAAPQAATRSHPRWMTGLHLGRSNHGRWTAEAVTTMTVKLNERAYEHARRG